MLATVVLERCSSVEGRRFVRTHAPVESNGASERNPVLAPSALLDVPVIPVVGIFLSPIAASEPATMND